MEKLRFQLPAAEDDLWEQVVLALLRQRDVSESQARDHLRLLEELAFHDRFCGKRLTHSFVGDTATWLAKEKEFGSPRDKAQDWLADLEKWELLIQHGNGSETVYEFPIPGLDEYFAARHLAARWAGEDDNYRQWLRWRTVWWRRGRRLRCPNPHCGTLLLPFRDLLRQPEHEETLLLMVGLLREAQREGVLLMGIRCHPFADYECCIRFLNFKLKSLSRCRHHHRYTAQAALNLSTFLKARILYRWRYGMFYRFHPHLAGKQHWRDISADAWQGWFYELYEGLSALTTARVHNNFAPVLKRCESRLTAMNWRVRMKAAWELSHIARRSPNAASPLISLVIPLLKDGAAEVRIEAAGCLGEIGDERAVEPLITALGDKGRNKYRWFLNPILAIDRYFDPDANHVWAESVVREACHALGQIGNTQAVGALTDALNGAYGHIAEEQAHEGLFVLSEKRGAEVLEDVKYKDGSVWQRWQP